MNLCQAPSPTLIEVDAVKCFIAWFRAVDLFTITHSERLIRWLHHLLRTIIKPEDSFRGLFQLPVSITDFLAALWMLCYSAA